MHAQVIPRRSATTGNVPPENDAHVQDAGKVVKLGFAHRHRTDDDGRCLQAGVAARVDQRRDEQRQRYHGVVNSQDAAQRVCARKKSCCERKFLVRCRMVLAIVKESNAVWGDALLVLRESSTCRWRKA
ncbi:MAG: hypothetical protein WD576_00215 [Nitriliruptoraceae bacterium]